VSKLLVKRKSNREFVIAGFGVHNQKN
jgi:hypothetical protein